MQYLDPVLRESCAGAHDEAHLWYSVYAVVEHSGSLKGGHYVAYVRVDDRAPSGSGLDVLCVLERCQLLLQEKDLLSLRKLLQLYMLHTHREQSETSSCAATSRASDTPRQVQLPAPPPAPAVDDSAHASGERRQSAGAAVANADTCGGPGPVASDTDSSEESATNANATPTDRDSTSKSEARWFYVSDSLVQPVSAEKAMAAQAYLLFYQRL